MSPSTDIADARANLSAFQAELCGWLPFREDAALLAALMTEVPPALDALARGYRISLSGSWEQDRVALSEGFALFNLLCRGAGLLGATPTASVALARATIATLRKQGLALPDACSEELLVIAVEGYSAGRDELRERSLREIAATSQVWFSLAPRCFCVFLAGSLLPDALERLCDDLARQLFRAQARSALIDVSRLHEAGEDQARAIVAFARTLSELGVEVTLYEERERLAPWYAQLALPMPGVHQSRHLHQAIARSLQAAGYDLRARGRLGELIDRVRAGPR